MANERRAGVCSVVAATLFWTALVAFGAVRTGYSHLTKAVSELGAVGAPHALAWNVLGFIVPGLLLAAAGMAIAAVVDGRSGPLRWLLTGSGLAFAATGIFPALMHHGSPVMHAPSTIGHVVMLLLSSLLWLIAVCLVLRTMSQQPRLRPLLVPCAIVTVIALLGFAANVFHAAIQPLAYRPGLAQRLGFAGYFLWFVWLSRRSAVHDGTDQPRREAQQTGVARA